MGAARTERASLDMRAATCLLRGAVSIRQSLRSCPAARSVQRGRRPSVRTVWTSASSSSAPDVSDGHTSSNKSPASDKSVMFVSFLWPEASSSAAGVRTGSLLRAFQSWGWRVHFVACAKPNRHAESLAASGVVTHHVPPNRGAEFEAALAAANPDAVVFDRFMAEEAFSFRVRAACPKAARILDMQDLHSLRYARQSAVETGIKAQTAARKAAKKNKRRGVKNDPGDDGDHVDLVEAAMAAVPAAGDDKLNRELASVHRCDLTMVCSPTETRLMRDTFGIPPRKMAPASFFCDVPEVNTNESTTPGFEPRIGFTTIGTFHHPPNVDSAGWLAHEVWPLIREQLPTATMRVYGSYPTPAIHALHSPKDGFLIEGFAPTVEGAMDDARVLLAPLRFGAGIKGKIVDAWMRGLPVVTTPVGAEGMVPGKDTLWNPGESTEGTEGVSYEQIDWGGAWTSTSAADVARDAIRLHENEEAWSRARSNGFELIGTLFPAERNLGVVRDAIEGLYEASEREGCETALDELRSLDFTGAALWHHSARSTEYFSRWIEMKETGGESGTPAAVEKTEEEEEEV